MYVQRLQNFVEKDVSKNDNRIASAKMQKHLTNLLCIKIWDEWIPVNLQSTNIVLPGS